MNRTSNPLVSVVIPVYNGEKYLSEAIESVLAQTYRPLEIIVVDDGSTDGTSDVIESFRDQVLHRCQENRGSSAARNTGVEMASGEFLAFLDADDVWSPEKTSRQLELMLSDPSVDMVSCHMTQFISPELPEDERQRVVIPPDLMDGFLPTTVVVRTESFHRAGLFDTRWTIGEFIDWHLRATEAGLKAETIEQSLAERRIHSTNKGIVKRAHISERARILKEALDRRRSRQSS